MPANGDSYVLPYTIDTLIRCLSEYSGNDIDVIAAKFHRIYFEEYFGETGVSAKTILIEVGYVDRDFLEDYACYYVKCFQNYPKHCTRLHFFGSEFDQKRFERLLAGEESADFHKEIQDAYLGFIVVKPLPKFVIGKTCLRTYPTGSTRYFPITREYKVNLYGLRFTIETLAFQEQDKVASACATSALWSAFQRTSCLFNHKVLSPIEITKAASKIIPSLTRTLPNQGLTVLQMADAMREMDLEPFHIPIEDRRGNSTEKTRIMTSILHAYVKGGVPVVMGFEIPGEGSHAVTISGFNLDSEAHTCGSSSLLLRSSRMNKVYAHDDGIGPFARMGIEDSNGVLKLSSSWRDSNRNPVRVTPLFLLIPLYHKVRVSFEHVLAMVSNFSGIVEGYFPFFAKTLRQTSRKLLRLEWDIYLTTNSSFKEDIICDPCLNGLPKVETLKESLPKYIWRATARSEKIPIFDLLFDATDMESGKTFLLAIEYVFHYACFVRHISRNLITSSEVKNVKEILEWFSERKEETLPKVTPHS